MVHIRNDVEFEKKRQQIMEAALIVFAEKGYEKATNKDIAEAAGVGSPGLIYHYFEDKGDLLREAVMAGLPDFQHLIRQDLLSGMPPREALTLVATTFLSSMQNASIVALFRVLMSEALRRPEMGAVWSTAVAGPVFGSLRRYLATQMDAGVLRRMDVGAAARCFLGPLFLYMLTHEVIPVHDSQTLTRETMVKTVVDVFLQGTEMRLALAGPDLAQRGREIGSAA
jgi:AcrR family transcriptional regulator